MKALAAAGAVIALAAAANPPKGDPARGERLFAECVACHGLEQGGNTPAGPTLHGVVGRRIAAEADYNYSPALRRFGQAHARWTPELIDRFLADPEGVVPGTEMGLIGIADPGERRDLVAFLQCHR